MTSRKIIVAVIWVLISFLTSSLPIEAQSTENGDPGKNGRAPDRNGGGGSRGPNCIASSNKQFRALVPKDPAQTIAELPTILVYTPYTSTTTTTLYARFKLQDDKDHDVMKPPNLILLPSKPGVILLTFHKQLEKGKSYHWYVTIICDSEQEDKNPRVAAWIKRVESSTALQSKLQGPVPPLNLVDIYSEEKLWIDALALLAKRPLDHDQKLAWTSLLKMKELNLQEFASEEIISCPIEDKIYNCNPHLTNSDK